MKRYFENMTSFSSQGRVTRTDIIVMYILTPVLIFLALVPFTLILGTLLQSGAIEDPAVPMVIFVLIASIYYSIIIVLMSIKRLHDTGKSGAYYWVTIIPMIGPFILLYFLFESPDVGPNMYGPDPRQIQ
jgi:uncharacterized membrane protein YhaH (DUF805 family)